MLYSHMQIHIYIYTCIYMQNGSQWHTDEGRAKTSLEKYVSHFICNVCVWEGVGDRAELQYIDPHSNGRQRCVFLILQGCSTGGPEAHSAGFLYYILSPTGLRNYWGPRGPLRPGVAFPTTSYQQLLWNPTHQGPQGPPPPGFLYHILSANSLHPNSIGGPEPLRPGVAFPTTSRLWLRPISNCLTSCLDRVIK